MPPLPYFRYLFSAIDADAAPFLRRAFRLILPDAMLYAMLLPLRCCCHAATPAYDADATLMMMMLMMLPPLMPRCCLPAMLLLICHAAAAAYDMMPAPLFDDIFDDFRQMMPLTLPVPLQAMLLMTLPCCRFDDASIMPPPFSPACHDAAAAAAAFRCLRAILMLPLRAAASACRVLLSRGSCRHADA